MFGYGRCLPVIQGAVRGVGALTHRQASSSSAAKPTAPVWDAVIY